jgi:uncharacterized glyoxalase superfamily protein PhnB
MSADNLCSPMSVGFTSSDMARSIAYYRDTLGFSLRECWPNEESALWCSLELGGQTVMLGAIPEDGMDCGHGGEMTPDMEWHNAGNAVWKQHAAARGTGVLIYIQVEDVDAYHAQVQAAGAAPHYEPKTQFYGIRDFGVTDPDGYRLIFHTPVAMETCQSCGMPLTEAQPGQMYCDHCTDDAGKLHPFEAILEGTTVGYFMGMQKLERGEAEVAAKEHLSKMPAWKPMFAGE